MAFPASFTRFRVLLVPAAVALLLVAWSIPSALMAKKVIGFLLMPSGLVWLGLLMMAGLPGLKAWGRGLCLSVLAAYSLAGNAWFGTWLLGCL